MRKSARHVGLAVVFCFCCLTGLRAFGGERPRCAVLTFDAGSGVDLGQTGALANRCSALLVASGEYDVLSRYNVNRILTAENLNPSTRNYASAAGRVLNAGYLIVGRVDRSGRAYLLNTSLVDIDRGKVIKSADYTYEGKVEDFIRLAPAGNLKLLLGLKKLPQPGVGRGRSVASVAEKPVFVPEPVLEPVPAVEAEPTPVIEPEPEPEPALEPRPAPVPEVVMPVKTEGRSRRKVVAGPSEKAGVVGDNRWEQFQQSASDTFGRVSKSVGDTYKNVLRDDSVQARLVLDRLQIGLHRTEFDLETTQRDGETSGERFIGTVNELRAEQGDSGPLFLRYFVVPWVGVELSNDKVRATAITKVDGHRDGSFVAEGPVVALIARASLEELLCWVDMAANGGEPQFRDRYRWAARVRPYIGYGRAFFSGSFDYEEWWRLGYSSEESWESLGRPIESNGRIRTMTVGDSDGTVTMLGCSVDVTDHLFVDFYMREMSLAVDAFFTISDLIHRTPQVRSIPLDNKAYSLGVGFAF